MITNNEEPVSLKLNYTLKSIDARKALVEEIVANASEEQLTPRYLEILSNYILGAISKEERKAKYITTDNRQVTINRRETSYEDLVSKFENGEDGVYNLINNDKNQYLTPRIEITEKDVAEIPGLRELREQIQRVEESAKKATGKKKYLLKKQIIEMRQQQYILKELWNKPMRSKTTSHTGGNQIVLDEEIYFDEKQEPVSKSLVSFFNPAHVCAILCNYEILKTKLNHKYNNDFFYMVQDFDKIMYEALEEYPAYLCLVKEKFKGHTNIEIQETLVKEFNLYHTVEYLSSLWRKKIPKLIAEKAKENYIIWYYTEVEKGNWKKCSKCGQIKLAHNRFFSKNNTSKDGYYSICKECRNKKNKEKKECQK